MSYRLGVDVGGTFTDLFLVNERSGEVFTAKVPSTPADQSIGVLNGIARVCEKAGVRPEAIDHVMHGTTVATNTVLTGTGARCGLVTTRGYRQVLQIARSFGPGGLGGWVIYNKSLPMAPLELTLEAHERVAANGGVVERLDEARLREDLAGLGRQGIEALTVSLINSFANAAHERRIRKIAAEVLPGIPVSLSSDVVPEMQEYERTVTTVANSYVRPRVAKYVANLKSKIEELAKDVKLHILRSDGGLAGAASAEEYPVNLLMSGPAGGVTGALWVAVQAGFPNLLTVDVGGTSTDGAVMQNGARLVGRHPHRRCRRRIDRARTRSHQGAARRPAVGGRRSRARGLRQRRYRADRHRRERGARLPAGDAASRRRDAPRSGPRHARGAKGRRCAEAPAEASGARDLPDREREHGGRAAPGLGRAGLRSAGLCTDRVRRRRALARERARSTARLVAGDHPARARRALRARRRDHRGARRARTDLRAPLLRDRRGAAERVPEGACAGRQGLRLTVDVSLEEIGRRGLAAISAKFDAEHQRLFTFVLDLEHEIVTLRAAVQGRGIRIRRAAIATGGADPKGAIVGRQPSFMDGRNVVAPVYERSRLKAGNVIKGPAIVMEMDSTTVILPKHHGKVDRLGNILIYPDARAVKPRTKPRNAATRAAKRH